MAIVIGYVLLVAYLLFLARYVTTRRTIDTSYPLALILFALGSAALLAVGRVGLGVEQAVTARYALLTMPGVIGSYFFFPLARIVSWRCGHI